MTNNIPHKIKKVLNTNIWQKPSIQKNRKVLNVERVSIANVSKLGKIVLVGFILIVFVFGIFGGGYYNQPLKAQTANILDTIRNWIPFLPQDKPTTTAPTTNEFKLDPQATKPYNAQTTQEEMIINVVKLASPAVVTIIISKTVPVYERYIEKNSFGPLEVEVPRYKQNGTQEQKVGSGSGFIVSKDGLLVTNKHVVSEKDATYTVLMNDGRKFQAKVLAKDPVQDLALIKIEQESKVSAQGQVGQEAFPVLRLGDSSKVQIGQTAIAIGNALGEFSNTVSVGVISGSGRTITAEGGGVSETLEDILQTDAAINKGNSGGPLLNLRGEVIGVNVAVAESAQSIGFAIPINEANMDIKQYEKQGNIARAFLGVRYVPITLELQAEKQLSVDYGVLIAPGEGENEPAITPGSAASKVGLKQGDIILEAGSEKITVENTLGKIIRKHFPQDTLSLKVLRAAEILTLTAVLGERTE